MFVLFNMHTTLHMFFVFKKLTINRIKLIILKNDLNQCADRKRFNNNNCVNVYYLNDKRGKWPK